MEVGGEGDASAAVLQETEVYSLYGGGGAVWAIGNFWKVEDNIATTGIRSPDRPACIESL